jgi:hypothetical protein
MDISGDVPNTTWKQDMILTGLLQNNERLFGDANSMP